MRRTLNAADASYHCSTLLLPREVEPLRHQPASSAADSEAPRECYGRGSLVRQNYPEVEQACAVGGVGWRPCFAKRVSPPATFKLQVRKTPSLPLPRRSSRR
eukprot:1399473-Rhodomonas_salina.1